MESTKLGRPKNIYGLSPAALNDITKRPSFTSLKTALEADSGFGVYGFVVNKARQHVMSLELIPTDRTSKFFWSRLLTADGEVSFAIPVVVSVDDLPALLAQWEFEDAKWYEGAPASPAFPAKWQMSKIFTLIKKRFWVLEFNSTTRDYFLTSRAGIHTMRGFNGECGGVVGEEDPWLLARMGQANRGVVLPVGTTGKVTDQVLHLCWSFSAAYFRNLILTPKPTFHNAVIPHALLLGIPLPSVTPFHEALGLT